jgi:molybdenum cofactor biosynthesis protein B
MSVTEHRAVSPSRVTCSVLTVSDTRIPETDRSGQAIVELLEDEGHAICGRALLPDEPAQVAAFVREAVARDEVQVLIITGGTGLSRRDSTCEAVEALFDKHISGFGELFRMLSFEEIGAAAMLSRATAGVAAGRAVFVLPGSEDAVRLAMSRLILPEIGHIVRELRR